MDGFQAARNIRAGNERFSASHPQRNRRQLSPQHWCGLTWRTQAWRGPQSQNVSSAARRRMQHPPKKESLAFSTSPLSPHRGLHTRKMSCGRRTTSQTSRNGLSHHPSADRCLTESCLHPGCLVRSCSRDGISSHRQPQTRLFRVPQPLSLLRRLWESSPPPFPPPPPLWPPPLPETRSPEPPPLRWSRLSPRRV